MHLKTKFLVLISTFFLLASFQGIAQEKKEITGIIRFQEKPVADVNITIEGTNIGTKTDAKGFYALKAKVGDVLNFSHVGFDNVSIILEDITSELNLNLDDKINQLRETIVTAKGSESKSSSGVAYDTNTKIKTAAGYINPFLFPSTVYYFPSKELGLERFATIADALKWKMPEDKIPGIYDVDGLVFKGRPLVNMARIKDVYVISGAAGTMSWGGPVIIIRTHDHPDEIKARKEKVAEQHRNQNYYIDDASVLDSETKFTSSKVSSPQLSLSTKREVYGIITRLDKPVVDVNIKLKNKVTGTKTDANGYYKLMANIGDEIIYSHTGLQTMVIRVEDVTGEINLDMLTNTNALDEVVVKANTRAQVVERGVLEQTNKKEESFNSARGNFNPQTAGYSIAYVDGEEILPIYKTLGEALAGKYAGYLGRGQGSLTNSGALLWDIDGIIYNSEPAHLDIQNIKDIHILKSLASTTKYGSQGRNGVIVVRTKSGYFGSKENNTRIANQYTNKTYYNNDALVVNTEELLSNDYTETIAAFKSKQEAYVFYYENLINTVEDYDIHISIAQKFLTAFDDKGKTISILNDLASKHQKNPEILKAIGFNLQAIDATKDALGIYKKIARLRPYYAQSYRDLANAYKENNEFKMSWRIYMNYLMNRNADKASAVDQIVYNEMEYLYFNRENQTDIKETFVPNNESKIKFRNDVRFVVEWNTSEAEFDLEFVGPERRAYVFEHTLANNQDLITNEKLKGISSDEFFVEDLGTSEWLMNLTYFGNKKSAPTYLKITTYYHWGKPKQHQEIGVYKLEKRDLKMQLKKINSQILLTFN